MDGQNGAAKTLTAQARNAYLELVILMATLERNIVLYPPEHESIRNVTESLRKQIEAGLGNHESLVIITSQEKMTIDGYALASDNSRVRMLATFLSQRGIVSVSLVRGLTTQELIRFFEILHQVPPKADIHLFPPLEEALLALPHITVTRFELASLRVQNKDQVEAPDEENLAENRWEKIIRSGMAGPENSDFIRSLYALLPEFEPSLQERILALPAENSGNQAYEELIDELSKQMPEEMLLALGNHAQSDNRQISPMLRKLLTSFSVISKHSAQSSETKLAGAIKADAIEKLFEREQMEQYIPADYSAQINAISMSGGKEADAGRYITSSFPDAELSEEFISRWLLKGFAGLLCERYEDEIYSGCFDQLTMMIPEFLERKEYGQLSELHRALSIIAVGDDPRAVPYVKILLKKYAESSFISKLNQVYSKADEETRRQLEELIICSGSENISWLFDLYLQSGSEKERNSILGLLLRFQSAASEVLLNRIQSLDRKRIRPILRLIPLCGGNPADRRLAPLLDAPEEEIRLEVIRLFLSAGSSEPIPRVESMIRSGDLATATAGIRLSGEFRVQSLTGVLVSQLRTVHISDAAAFRNRIVFESLSQIGDPAVLPKLIKVARKRFSFSPARLRLTKEALFSNLSGYPKERLTELLEAGRKSKNPSIQKCVQKYN